MSISSFCLAGQSSHSSHLYLRTPTTENNVSSCFSTTGNDMWLFQGQICTLKASPASKQLQGKVFRFIPQRRPFVSVRWSRRHYWNPSVRNQRLSTLSCVLEQIHRLDRLSVTGQHWCHVCLQPSANMRQSFCCLPAAA